MKRLEVAKLLISGGVLRSLLRSEGKKDICTLTSQLLSRTGAEMTYETPRGNALQSAYFSG